MADSQQPKDIEATPSDETNNPESEVTTTPESIPVPPEVQEVKVMSPNVIIISEAENPRAKWYIVHVYSGHENKVSEALRQRTQTLNLEDMILQTLIPTQEKIQIKRGQRKTVKEKIFPGYMLIKMEMTDQSWLAVKTTQGVTGFVGTGGNKPLPLSKAEVEAIQKYVSQTAPKFKVDYIEGEAVKIIDGPFNDFLGAVSKIDEAKGKLEVLINIFGRETPVELDFLQVQKVN
jgi:transcriptional antiterminator NusG